MKFGYPGRMFEIPPPSTGMGFSNNSDTETLELDTGGRFVADKVTTYKSFNMSWRSSTPKLQPLIDAYNKRYGTDPFYMQDLNGGVDNILPARWAYPQQLAAIHGAIGNATYYGGFASFSTARYAASAPTLLVPLILGKPMHLAVFKSFGDMNIIPIRYRLINKAGVAGAWKDCPYVKSTNGNAPHVLCTAVESQTNDFVEIKVNIGKNIAIEHMDMSTSDYRAYDEKLRSAVGVGGLKFTNTLDGDLTMLKAKRIGLSVDLTEVQQ